MTQSVLFGVGVALLLFCGTMAVIEYMHGHWWLFAINCMAVPINAFTIWINARAIWFQRRG